MQYKFVKQRLGLVCLRAPASNLEVLESQRERCVHPNEEIHLRSFTKIIWTDATP